MSVGKDRLIDVAREHVGESLRTVATYHEREHDLIFLRDDIADQYSTEEIRRVFDELALSGLGQDYLESIFHAGKIECAAYGFEDAAMFHFATNDAKGVFASFDRDVEVNLDAFISDYKSAITVLDM